MAMTNNLDMSNNKIINVKDASENLDVVNLKQLNNSVYSVVVVVFFFCGRTNISENKL